MLVPLCKILPPPFPGRDITVILENVEHCGGEPEQAANGFVMSKIVW